MAALPHAAFRPRQMLAMGITYGLSDDYWKRLPALLTVALHQAHSSGGMALAAAIGWLATPPALAIPKSLGDSGAGRKYAGRYLLMVSLAWPLPDCGVGIGCGGDWARFSGRAVRGRS